MSDETKKIPISEFRNRGYLQELNRRFLHPLGLALEVVVAPDGSESLGGIWDSRGDDEGIFYDWAKMPSNELCDARAKAAFVEQQLLDRRACREKKLGFFIEPTPTED